MLRFSQATRNLAFLAAAVALPLHSAASQAPAKQPAAPAASATVIDEVWAMEDSYWRFVKAGDVTGYLTLWHKDFRGWPCADEHPATKANISDWVRDIRDKKVKFSYALTHEGGTSVGGTVVVYYRTPMTYVYPDGHTEGPKKPVKITHSWMKVDGKWQIIGGMCGADAPK